MSTHSPATPATPRRSHRSAKSAGTRFESLIATYLAHELDDDRIERRARNGAKDRGDIAGVKSIRGGRVVLECKDTARDALPSWIDEAEVERGNDDAAVGVVIHKRRGHGAPGDQFVSMTVDTFLRLLDGAPDESLVLAQAPEVAP